MCATEVALTAVSKPAAASVFRSTVRADDVTEIRQLVKATGFFSDDEVDVAVELIEDRLRKGAASDYQVLLVECDGRVCGYACFGLVPCTTHSFDLYWIVVDPGQQGRGIGKMLLARCEEIIRRAGGARLYAETSSRPQYRPTRAYYRRAGFHRAARVEDFYAPGDSKIIYCKVLLEH